MKRIFEITNTKSIRLDNVKVPFQVKLLQYNINNILFKYNNKYAFQPVIETLKAELVKAINDSNLKDNNEAQELITKVREIYKTLNSYIVDNTGIDIAVDNSLKYLLYAFNKNKLTLTIQQELILLNELKMLKEIITLNNITITERIKNAYKLIGQLKESIIAKL